VSQTDWWAEQLESTLSQGDIVVDLPVLVPTASPTTHLKKNTFKGGIDGWVTSNHPVLDGNGRSNFLAVGRSVPVVILSHSCELDKDKARVIVAPVAQITTVEPSQRDGILEQKHFALMPLPDVPELGTCFADLRSVAALHRTTVDEGRRIASMTALANKRLAAQIVAFFCRVELPSA
jgi:hypothetical protein